MNECAGMIHGAWVVVAALIGWAVGTLTMAMMADAKARDKRAGRD